MLRIAGISFLIPRSVSCVGHSITLQHVCLPGQMSITCRGCTLPCLALNRLNILTIGVVLGMLVLSCAVFVVLGSLSTSTIAGTTLVVDWISPSCSRIGSSMLSLVDSSAWGVLVCGILASAIGLWSFSSYLEFDKAYLAFTLRLILFLFSVWLVISACALYGLLLAWEVIGLISFLLIGHFSVRSFTSSSSYSAIGFNRIGDVSLVVFIVCMGFAMGYMSTTLTSLLLVCLTCCLVFKSVVGLTLLWLPEAMEGPTPVSSLLHSCTLVMAGIFVFSQFQVPTTTLTMEAFGLSLLIVCLTSRMEKDFKRVIAFSTCVMVGFTWFLMITGTTVASIVVCAFHAAYKSCLFVLTGRVLVLSSTYTDNLWISPSSGNTMVVLPILFLIGFRMTSYATGKHTYELTSILTGATSVVSLVIVGCGFLIVWVIGLCISSNWKHYPSQNTSDMLQFPMVLSIVAGITSLCGVVSVVSGVAFTGTSFVAYGITLFLLFVRSSIRTLPTIGSVLLPTTLISALITSKYALVRSVVMGYGRILASIKVTSTLLGLLPVACSGFLLLMLVGKWHYTIAGNTTSMQLDHLNCLNTGFWYYRPLRAHYITFEYPSYVNQR